MNYINVVQTIIAFLSLVIAAIVYLSSRKLFILDVINKRADKVNNLFNYKSKDGSAVFDHKSGMYVWFWTDIISELVITKNILDKLSDSSTMSKWLLNNDDFKYIFWEQLHTTVRVHFQNYTSDFILDAPNDDENTKTRKEQLRSILKYYKVKLNNPIN